MTTTKKFPASFIIRLATTPGKMNDLDDAECLEGYWDGRNDGLRPGPNRTDSYVQGWWAGMRDGNYRDYHPVDHDIVTAWLENEQLCRSARDRPAGRATEARG